MEQDLVNATFLPVCYAGKVGLKFAIKTPLLFTTKLYRLQKVSFCYAIPFHFTGGPLRTSQIRKRLDYLGRLQMCMIFHFVFNHQSKGERICRLENLSQIKTFFSLLPSYKMVSRTFDLNSNKKSESLYECPLCLFKISRLWATDFASNSRTDSVSSQPIHASVILTPYFRPDLPSLGTFWLPTNS
jgi:hypothetical protein